MDVRKRRHSAYERVIGPLNLPSKVESDESAEDDAREKTLKEKLFDALLALTENPIFNGIVIAAIVFNMVALILLTYPEYAARYSYFFTVCDCCFLAVYHVEATIKLLALGRTYFASGWNLLDFFILLTSWLDFLFPFFLSSNIQATRVLRVLRAMRALRALRMLSVRGQLVQQVCLMAARAMSFAFLAIVVENSETTRTEARDRNNGDFFKRKQFSLSVRRCLSPKMLAMASQELLRRIQEYYAKSQMLQCFQELLQTIAFLQSLQTIVNTVFSSMSSMAVIFFLMLLFMYMFAVMGRQLYSAPSPYYFGDLFRAVTTLFQLLTFDSWFYMYDDVTKSDGNYWHFIIFAIAYTLVEYFIFLNLFMAVLVDNFQSQLKEDEAEEEAEQELPEVKEENAVLEDAKSETRAAGTSWPVGKPTAHYSPYLEDLGHLPMEERIMYVQFYNVLCSLDYQAYIQKQNFLFMHKLLDKCQDPRLLLNTQAEHE